LLAELVDAQDPRLAERLRSTRRPQLMNARRILGGVEDEQRKAIGDELERTEEGAMYSSQSQFAQDHRIVVLRRVLRLLVFDQQHLAIEAASRRRGLAHL
jgi:hypothetical protein